MTQRPFILIYIYCLLAFCQTQRPGASASRIFCLHINPSAHSPMVKCGGHLHGPHESPRVRLAGMKLRVVEIISKEEKSCL